MDVGSVCCLWVVPCADRRDRKSDGRGPGWQRGKGYGGWYLFGDNRCNTTVCQLHRRSFMERDIAVIYIFLWLGYVDCGNDYGFADTAIINENE